MAKPSLEGDVVVRAAAGADSGALEVRGVGRHVRLGLEAVAPATLVVRARAEELHALGDDLHGLALGPVLGLPFPPVEPSLHGDRAPLREILGAVLALRSPDGDVEVVGFVHPLAALVLAAAVDGDSKLADGGPAGGRAQLGVA